MKTTAKWGVIAVLTTAGLIGFACGGGEATPPANTPSASAPTTTAAPTASTPTAATSSATPVATTPPPPPAPPPLVVSAMKFSAPKVKAVEVKDDGSVMVDNKPMGKFVGAELQDKDGKTLIAVGADGVVKMEGATKTMKFNDKDELEVEGGAKMSIGDDGVVKMINPDGKADKDSGKAKFTGFKPTARRAATVLVIAMLMPHPAAATAASAAPKASAAPSAKPAPKK